MILKASRKRKAVHIQGTKNQNEKHQISQLQHCQPKRIWIKSSKLLRENDPQTWILLPAEWVIRCNDGTGAFSDVRCFRKISSPVYTVFSKMGEQTKKEKHKEPENSGSTWENGEGEAPRQLGYRLESEGGRFQEEPPQEQVNQTHGLMCWPYRN